MDIKGKTVTANAMHCQKETCRKIIKQNGNYLFGLKGNHQGLFADVKLFFDNVSNSETEWHSTTEKNAGRIEKRICRKMTDISWLEDREKWPGLQSVFSIQGIVDARGKHSDETNYYISSLNLSPEQLMKIAREHWKIESLQCACPDSYSDGLILSVFSGILKPAGYLSIVRHCDEIYESKSNGL